MTDKIVDKPQTILELHTRNVKRIKAVQITPDGEIVVIGGNNAQGKTSTLDSIVYAFEGKRSFPSKVVREGTTEAEIVVKTQDLEIRRTIDEDGKSVLELRKGGVRVKSSPQNALKALTEGISFDPEAFTRMSAKDQAEHLRRLVKLDLSDLDTSYEREFSERRDVNRDLNNAKGALDQMPFHPGVPDEEKSASDFVKELEEVRKHNGVQASRTQRLSFLRAKRDDFLKRQADLTEDISKMEKELEEVGVTLEEIAKEGKNLKIESDAFEPKSEDAILESMKDVENTNRKVRENRERLKMEERVRSLKDRADRLTASLEGVKEERQRRISSVKMPIDGLALDDSGLVTYRGMPYSECSTAEKRKIAASIGLKSNPNLPVMLIRDGSALDRNSLKELAEIAKAEGAQVWIERVTEDEDGAIIIEDGAVVPAEEIERRRKAKTDQGSFKLN